MSSLPAAEFGALLQQHRRAAGLTQEELAERAGLSARGISDLERGVRHSPQRETVRLLADALNLSPAEREALATAARPSRPLAPGTAAQPTVNLPNPPTSLIGRQPQVAAVAEMLRDEQIRLLTMTGAGGVGKTRLAVAAAQQAAPTFPDGVTFVDLVPVTDPARVPAAIAAALGIQETGINPILITLKAALGERRLLLVLDNCEHLLAAVPDIATLLAECSGLTILATSRAPLRLQAEHQLHLPPLPLPPLAPLPALAELAQVPAVTLFVERAQAARADFALTDDNAWAVAAICHRLDGLPLAIELAAARVKLLPPAALLSRLEARLPLLKGGPRDQDARHQTMRDTIAWTHDLLSPAEQALCRRLAVFAGGFTLDEAEWVMRQWDEADDVLDGIAGLVDWSLLRQIAGAIGEPRFAMLETVREFAAERLRASGEATAAANAHAGYFLHLAATTEMAWFGSEFANCMARWLPETANLRAALDWLESTGETDRALALMATTGFFWLYAGPVNEGRVRYDRVLAAGDPTPTPTRTSALEWAANLAGKQGDIEAQLILATESVAVARACGDVLGVAFGLCALGRAMREHGEAAQTGPLFTEALAIFRANDAEVMGAVPLVNLALLAADEGDSEQARALCTEALNLRLGEDNAAGAAIVRHVLADLTRQWGELTTAASLYRENLEVYRDVSDWAGVADSLAGIALTTATAERREQTLRLLAAASAVHETMGVAIHTGLQTACDAFLVEARGAYGASEFAAIWAAGQAMPMEQAIDEALALADEEVSA